jgi:RNase H-fold protein (predicted Holliday junction resolvase)
VNSKDAKGKIDMAAAVAILEQAIALDRAKDV